jgi:hypothetical protein
VALTDALARVRFGEGNYAQAETLLAKVLEGRRRQFGPEHLSTLRAASAVARVQIREQKYAAAESILAATLESYRKIGPEIWERFRCESLLGASLEGQKRYAEAEPLLISGYEGMRQRLSVIPAGTRPVVTEAENAVAQLYRDWGKPQKADEWRAKRAR